jgi:hypothetical protein
MSVADQLRREQQAAVANLTVAQRIQQAFDLGKRDLALYAATHALDLTTARNILTKQRKAGRVTSGCADG